MTREAWHLLRLAAPMATVGFLDRGAFWVTWALVGRLADAEQGVLLGGDRPEEEAPASERASR